MDYSKIVTIGSGGPVIGIVGMVHGNEPCGKHVLDELQSITPLHGTLKLIYANLPAMDANKRYMEANLNRVFPGKADGKLEERIAHGLLSELGLCDYVIDIHATYDPTPGFSIATQDNEKTQALVEATGLDYHVLMTGKLAKGGALIDYVNSVGGTALSFGAGSAFDDTSTETARAVVFNMLRYLGVITGESVRHTPHKFVTQDVVLSPSPDFRVYDLEPFSLLQAGTPYGRLGDTEVSLDHDCHIVLPVTQKYTKELDGLLFLQAKEIV